MRNIIPLALILTLIIARPTRAQQKIDELIQALADPDSQKRESAEVELTKRGAEARTALIQASRTSGPAVAAAAARVLLNLPWHRADDPTDVQQTLSTYGSLDDAGRIEIVQQLGQKSDGVGQPALLRLIMEEPSNDVGWKIVGQLRNAREPNFLERVRQLNPADDRPAALTLVGLAWVGKDSEKSHAFLRRAIEVEAQRPTFDDGELNEAFDLLSYAAVAASRFDEAARLRRLQSGRIGLTPEAYPRSVYQLFLLHGRYGPLAGFQDDVRDFSQYLGHSQVLYSLSRVYARSGRSAEAMACFASARAAGLSTATHLQIAGFFASTGWSDPIRYECYAVPDAPYVPTSPDDEVSPLDATLQRISARRMLASAAAQDENDTAVIEHYTAVLALMNELGLQLTTRGHNGEVEPLRPEHIEAQIAWRRARLAGARNDQPAVTRHLNELMVHTPLDSDVVQNVYPLLKAAGRNEDAQAIFDDAYARGRERLEKYPNDPIEMNDLAWLMARCDQKLPEALDLATRAVAAQPDDAALIDTLAEVHHRMGNMAEAVRLESRALQLRPEDTFMQMQIERFRKGLTGKAQ